MRGLAAATFLACFAVLSVAPANAQGGGGGPATSPSRQQPQRQQPQRQQPRQQQQTPDDQNPDFWLRNNSDTQIDNVNVSRPEDTNWGRDRLGRDEVIRPGDRGAIRLNSPGTCRWDVRVVYHDHREEERRNVDLCNIAELAFDASNARVPEQQQQQQPQQQQEQPQQDQQPDQPSPGGGKPETQSSNEPRQQPRQQPRRQPEQAQSDNPNFWLVNRSSTRIDRINVSLPSDTQWGADRLGDDVVEPGSRYAVRLNARGKCVWDVRVIYHDSREEERRGVNLCGVAELAFDGSNAHAPENNTQNPSVQPRSNRPQPIGYSVP